MNVIEQVVTSVQEYKHQDHNKQHRLKYMDCIAIFSGVILVNDDPHLVVKLKSSIRKA
jgi:hypothetical protein